MTSLPSNFLSLLLIPLAPWSLEHAARNARLSHAAVLGLFVGPLVVAIPLGAEVASIGEPFASLASYLSDSMRAMGCLFFPALLVCGCIVNGLWNEVLRDPLCTDRRRARRCVILLLPLTLLLPALLWAAAVLIRPLPNPAFGIGTGKPAWIMSDFIQTLAAALGSPIWLLVTPAAAIVFAVRIRRRMSSTPFPDEERMCPACLYPLATLPPGAPCPECGT